MKFGVVMDPIEAINFKKDSSLDIMIEAQERGHELFYIEPSSLYINEEGSHALMNEIKCIIMLISGFILKKFQPRNFLI